MIKNSFLKVCAIGAALLLFSCGKDDKKDNTNTDSGIPVGDGFYVSKKDGVPGLSDQLKAEKVEGPGFSAVDRDGFFSNYIYLAAGEYNIVSIVDQKKVRTYGGVMAEADLSGSDCNYNKILLIEEYAENGAAFNVASAGLYKVIFDNTSKDIVLYKIEVANVIGSATPAGWSHADNQKMNMVGAASATGVNFKVDNLVLRRGEYKVRFNCRWTLGRGEGASAYAAFTNFGGTLDALVAGGPNFSIAAGGDGTYSVTASWTPSTGFKLTVTKTGDAPVVTFNPEEYAWEIIGSATAGGWDTGTDLNYEGKTGSTYTWRGTFELSAAEFKFRTNDSWTFNVGYGQVTITGDKNDISNGGTGPDGNFKLSTAGKYTITITTSDDGETWTVNFQKVVS
jgi:hypothetical protein